MSRTHLLSSLPPLLPLLFGVALVSDNVLASSPTDEATSRAFAAALAAQGWQTETLPDGSVIYRRPPPTAGDAGAMPETPASGEQPRTQAETAGDVPAQQAERTRSVPTFRGRPLGVPGGAAPGGYTGQPRGWAGRYAQPAWAPPPGAWRGAPSQAPQWTPPQIKSGSMDRFRSGPGYSPYPAQSYWQGPPSYWRHPGFNYR